MREPIDYARDSGNGERQPRESARPVPQSLRASSSGETQGAQLESVSDTLPHVTLPKGGGAIRGIGEKFGVNPVTGTGSLTIPLALSPGRSGFTPQLELGYDSGSGNGPFGLGWALSLPAITRKTDKGLPRYRDSDESDVFILSGAEDLVPELDGAGQRVRNIRTLHGKTYEIVRYRPRIEGLFARIERWTEISTGLGHWRSISSDNVTSLYGFDSDSRVADPDDPLKIFTYRLCRSWDDKGNIAVYDYIVEDGVGINRAQAHEANRSDQGRSAQCYLKSIHYGNLQPWFPNWQSDGLATVLPGRWLFTVVFDYGDHALAAPTPARDRPWPVRPDPFSSYRAGFEIRTYRRVERILVFHDFPEEADVGADCLVRSMDLLYSDQAVPLDAHNPIYTFLASVTQTGYRPGSAGYISRTLPPLELEYSQAQIQPAVLSLDRDSLANLPEGIDGTTLQMGRPRWRGAFRNPDRSRRRVGL